MVQKIPDKIRFFSAFFSPHICLIKSLSKKNVFILCRYVALEIMKQIIKVEHNIPTGMRHGIREIHTLR